MNLPAREVYRERQIRQLEEDAQWVAERLERRMNIPAPQREAGWRRCAPLSRPSPGAALSAAAGEWRRASAGGIARAAGQRAGPVQAQFPRDAAPLFGSHYQTIQPFAPHQRMLSRAERQRGAGGLESGDAGAGWWIALLLVAYRWPVTIGARCSPARCWR